MCMKYESEYGACWDYLGFYDEDESLIVMLHREYGADVTDRNEFINRLFSLFAKMHEDGIIKPSPKQTAEEIMATWPT